MKEKARDYIVFPQSQPLPSECIETIKEFRSVYRLPLLNIVQTKNKLHWLLKGMKILQSSTKRIKWAMLLKKFLKQVSFIGSIF